MPIYSYECDYCEHKADEYQKMSSDPLTACPKCKTCSYYRVPTIPHTNLIEFHKPIEMFSIACNNDAEIREMQLKVPGLDISTDPRDEMYGVPIARNRAQKLAALNAAGFVETN